MASSPYQTLFSAVQYASPSPHCWGSVECQFDVPDKTPYLHFHLDGDV